MRPKTKKGRKPTAILAAKIQRSKSQDRSDRPTTIEDEETRLRNMQWILDRMEAGEVPIYTMDLETDPFKRDEVPVPFLAGLYDGLNFRVFKTDRSGDCITKIRCAFEDGTLEPGIVYMHNGGRFDFFYMLDWFEGRTTIIGSRIVKALMPIHEGKKNRFARGHCFEFRDSYAIMPFPLKAYEKKEIDITKLKRDVRAQHMQEIIDYLEVDCTALWTLCMEFQREFGDYVTIASAAFKQLTSFHKYDTLSTGQDQMIRSQFYYGGRVQCFEKGVIEKQDIEIFDVNSMYPFVMDSYFHPVGWCVTEDRTIHGWNHDATFNSDKLKTFFMTVEGENKGAFPCRKKDGSVDFTEGYGVFNVTIHEWLVAIELGLFKPTKIHRCLNYRDYSRFHLFVDHFYRARERAKKAGDKIHSLFYKYILNSAYGKFGLNPENYFNWKITKTADAPEGNLWELDTLTHDKFFVWKQPNQLSWNVKNIGTAASITGAARSVLLRAIASSNSVLYCDTDSIICKGFAGGKIDETKLGAWKLEGTGDRVAIAGKKLYAVFRGDECIKHACKGVSITPLEIERAARGENIFDHKEAPTFHRDGTATFLTRTVRMT